MSSKCMIIVLIALCMLGAWVAATSGYEGAAATIPIKRGSPQLFVDDELIASHGGLQRVLLQPSKDAGGASPVIATKDLGIEEPGTLEANGTILFDPRLKRYVMFALAYLPSRPDWRKAQLYRLTSPDGMNWRSGDDGKPQPIFPIQAQDLKDPDSGLSATNIDLCSFYYDPKDESTPYKGWIWFANMGDREGLYYISSAEGIRWKRGQIITGIKDFTFRQDGWELFGAGDVSIFSPDPVSGRFLALIKLTNRKAIGPGNRQRSRAFLFVDRLDQRIDPAALKRVDLVPPVAAEGGSQPWDEYYASTAWQCGSLWLGGLKIWHGGGNYTYSAAGCAFLKLISSRDGLHWKKARYPNNENTLEVWIPNGPEGGNSGGNDGGYITEFSQGPLRIGDQWIYYYASSSLGKNHAKGIRLTGGGVFRARMRPEALVSVDAGWLWTRQFRVDGDQLTVNGVGPITVDLMKRGQPVATSKITGDSLAHPIMFEGKSLRAVAGTEPVAIRFSIGRGGHLYAFTLH